MRKIILLLLIITTLNCCAQKQQSKSTAKISTIKNDDINFNNVIKKTLDKVKHYDKESKYFIRPLQNNCVYELLVNDYPIYKDYGIEKLATPIEINHAILKSGPQMVTVRLYPLGDALKRAYGEGEPITTLLAKTKMNVSVVKYEAFNISKSLDDEIVVKEHVAPTKKGSSDFIGAGLLYYEYTIVSIQNVDIIDAEKQFENLIGVFSKKNDSIVIYKLDNDTPKNIVSEYIYTSKKKDLNTRFFFSSEFKDSTKVNFQTGNKIFVNNDIYNVNTEYYSFLKQKIIEEGSILDFTTLIDDQYGDYCSLYSLLINNTWNTFENNKNNKILNVEVNNDNYQTEDELYNWKVTYTNQNATGERFNKTLIEDNEKHLIYSINKHNERSEFKTIIYKNKKTKLDSIVGKWSQNSNNNSHDFISYQTKLEIKKVNLEQIKNKKNLLLLISN